MERYVENEGVMLMASHTHKWPGLAMCTISNLVSSLEF